MEIFILLQSIAALPIFNLFFKLVNDTTTFIGRRNACKDFVYVGFLFLKFPALKDESIIQAFSERYVVDQDLVVKHIQSINQSINQSISFNLNSHKHFYSVEKEK